MYSRVYKCFSSDYDSQSVSSLHVRCFSSDLPIFSRGRVGVGVRVRVGVGVRVGVSARRRVGGSGCGSSGSSSGSSSVVAAAELPRADECFLTELTIPSEIVPLFNGTHTIIAISSSNNGGDGTQQQQENYKLDHGSIVGVRKKKTFSTVV